jgi:hypothetical protein
VIILKERFERIYIDGKESNYLISSDGRCYNEKRGKFLKSHNCERRKYLLEPLDKSNNYKVYTLYYKGKSHNYFSHRLVAHYFVPIPEKYLKIGLCERDLVVDHIDNYRPNNKASNLQWMTSNENFKKMLESGNFRVPSGTEHPNCKYTEDQLDAVGRLLKENNLSYSEISKATGVPIKTISKIKTGVAFKYLSDKYDFSDYNYKANRYDDSVIKTIIEMIDNDIDIPLSKIAKICGVSKSLVKDIYHKRIYKKLSQNHTFERRKNKK